MQPNIEGSSAPALVGRGAVVAGVTGTVLAPVHALSRYATADGAEDATSPLVRWWAQPAADLLEPLLGWADADTVYLTYGKLWLPVLALATAYAVLVRRGRRPSGLERWAWPVLLTGSGVLTLGTFGSYWTPWLDESFLALVVPGLLLALAGGLLLGIALLRTGFRPRATGWLLLLWLPLLVALGSVLSLGAGVLPLVWSWALAARARVAAPAGSVPAPADAHR